MKNAYFSLNALFVLKIFNFLSRHFGHVEKQFHKKDKVIFKIYDVITWLTNNCNTHIKQYFKTSETFFPKNDTQNMVEKLFPDLFLKTKIEHISGSIV